MIISEQEIRAIFWEKISQKPKITTYYGFSDTKIRYYRLAFKKNTITIDTILEVLDKFGQSYDCLIGIAPNFRKLDEVFEHYAQNTDLNLGQPKAYSKTYKIDFLKSKNQIYVCFAKKSN